MVRQDLKNSKLEKDCNCHLSGGLETVGGLAPSSQAATEEQSVQFQWDGTVLENYVLLKAKCFSAVGFNKVPSRKEKYVLANVVCMGHYLRTWVISLPACFLLRLARGLLSTAAEATQKMDFFQRLALKAGNRPRERWKSFCSFWVTYQKKEIRRWLVTYEMLLLCKAGFLQFREVMPPVNAGRICQSIATEKYAQDLVFLTDDTCWYSFLLGKTFSYGFTGTTMWIQCC